MEFITQKYWQFLPRSIDENKDKKADGQTYYCTFNKDPLPGDT